MDEEPSAFTVYNTLKEKKLKKAKKPQETKVKQKKSEQNALRNDDDDFEKTETLSSIVLEGAPAPTRKYQHNKKFTLSAENGGELPTKKLKKKKIQENGNVASVNLDGNPPKVVELKNPKRNKPVLKKKAKIDLALPSIKISKKHVKAHETAIERVFAEFSKRALSKTDSAPLIVKEPPAVEKAIVPVNVYSNSIEEGASLLSWLLDPVTLEEFFDKFWETDVLLVARRNVKVFNNLISFEMIDQMMLQNNLEFTKNIDITSYKNGVRETHNPDGRAMPPAVWEQYGNGHSIRILNPQTFLPTIYSMCTTLQEYFHCMVGANVYLTPPNSQGFAPHYDDIEAFVLQIEGRKRWKLYNTRKAEEDLPRTSSKNFSQDEVGEPILNEVLRPGDLLYFPRGTIHQACTEPGYHSLHITISVYQKQSYADLFERMLPIMLNKMIAKSVDMRRGVPLNIWKNTGVVHSDSASQERKNFIAKCNDLMMKCIKELPIDEAVDQLAKKYQHEALPPELTQDEISRTIFGSKSVLDEKGECLADYEITLESKIRLLRAHILRLVEEDGVFRVYYYLENSLEYCEYKPNFIQINPEDASSITFLIKMYPNYASVSELPLENDERKISVSLALLESGLLMLENPIN